MEPLDEHLETQMEHWLKVLKLKKKKQKYGKWNLKGTKESKKNKTFQDLVFFVNFNFRKYGCKETISQTSTCVWGLKFFSLQKKILQSLQRAPPSVLSVSVSFHTGRYTFRLDPTAPLGRLTRVPTTNGVF